MKEEKLILTIGDIHGENHWKKFLFNDDLEFFFETNKIRSNVQEIDKYDKVIFIGDYCDSYTKTDDEIFNNLVEIIDLKKANKDKVVLLIGNHDFGYMYPKLYTSCSGFRYSMAERLKILFEENLDLFQLAYKQDIINDKKVSVSTLWTHAGVRTMWIEQVIAELKDQKDIFQNLIDTKEYDVFLNLLLKEKPVLVYSVDHYSGGSNEVSSCTWVRPEQLKLDSIEMNQIVGHTSTNKIITYKTNHENITFKTIDCLTKEIVLISKF